MAAIFGDKLIGGVAVYGTELGVDSSFSGAVVLDDFTITSDLGAGTPSSMSGTIVLDSFTVSATFASDNTSQFTGALILDDFTVTGTFGGIPQSQFTGDLVLGSFTVTGVFSSVGTTGVLDPTSPRGRVRLKIGDYSDLPILPDSVIDATLAQEGDNVNRAAAICAQYILGALTSKTHKKLAQLETWSGEQFNNYVKFLQLTVLNPNLTTIAPVPYNGATTEDHPIQQFVNDWKDGYNAGSFVMPTQKPGRAIEYAY